MSGLSLFFLSQASAQVILIGLGAILDDATNIFEVRQKLLTSLPHPLEVFYSFEIRHQSLIGTGTNLQMETSFSSRIWIHQNRLEKTKRQCTF